MSIEDVIKEWRKLPFSQKQDAAYQIQSLCDAEKIEQELNEEADFLEEKIEQESGNDRDPSVHHVCCSDFLKDETIKKLKRENLYADLIFTSPPYNADLTYEDGFDDDKPLHEYVDFLNRFLKNGNKLLKEGGRFVINIRDIKVKPGVRYPILSPLYNFLTQLGYTYRGMHIWYKGREESSFAWGSWRQSRQPSIIDLYEYVFVFQKGDYPKGEDNLAKTEFIENVIGVWKIRPVKKITGKGKKNIANHPCPFPIELPKRIIKLYSHVDDLVLDPFAGVASTSIAALRSGRNSLAVEISQKYCNEGLKKLKKEANDIFGGKEIKVIK